MASISNESDPFGFFLIKKENICLVGEGNTPQKIKRHKNMLNKIFLFQTHTKKDLITNAVMILCLIQISAVNRIQIVPRSTLNYFSRFDLFSWVTAIIYDRFHFVYPYL